MLTKNLPDYAFLMNPSKPEIKHKRVKIVAEFDVVLDMDSQFVVDNERVTSNNPAWAAAAYITNTLRCAELAEAFGETYAVVRGWGAI